LLYEQIGNSIDSEGNIKYGISGTSFAWELQYLQDKCSKINVRINSIGGSVLDGYSIVSAILTSKIPVDTYIDGLAASISGVIALCGKKVRMMDYGTLMMHNASGSDDLEVLALVNNTISTIISNRTSKTKEEISAMMEVETYLLADEALNMGLVDEVINTSKKIKVKKESLMDMALVYNKLITNKPKMEKVLNILSVTNEDEAIVAIEAINAEQKTLVEEVDSLKAKIAEYELQEQALKNAKEEQLKVDATALVEKAISDKKVKEDEKEELIINAIANFGFVSNMLSKISGVKNAVKVFDLTNVATKKGAEDRSTWNIRDWEKKDEAGLKEMKNTDENTYNELFNAFYKKSN
jgi:ATP-dependent protease ClpP protease subunit